VQDKTRLSVKGRKRHEVKILSKIKQGCRTVFTKQLSLVNLAVMGIIMNYSLKVMVRTIA